MITLTNTLLFLILVTLLTYVFMPWKNIDKGPIYKQFLQWLGWFAIFLIFLIIFKKLNFII